MARASTSLPTPDSPSISTGMFDFAARSARRITRVMSGLAVARSLKLERARRRAGLHAADLVLERVDPHRVLDRDLQPLGPDRLDDEVDRAGPHRRDDGLDGAVRGLHDDRRLDRHSRSLREHADAVEVGHHEVEDDDVDARRRPASRRSDSAASPLSAKTGS